MTPAERRIIEAARRWAAAFNGPRASLTAAERALLAAVEASR